MSRCVVCDMENHNGCDVCDLCFQIEAEEARRRQEEERQLDDAMWQQHMAEMVERESRHENGE